MLLLSLYRNLMVRVVSVRRVAAVSDEYVSWRYKRKPTSPLSEVTLSMAR